MTKENQTLENIIYEILEDFVFESIVLFKSEIEATQISATGELLKSFQGDVLKSAAKIEAEIKFNFYGKFRDMKEVAYGKTPPSAAIEAWIMDVGPSKFRLPQAPTISKAVKKLVWAILRDVSKTHKIVNKKGAWKSTPQYFSIVGKYRSKIAREAGKLVAHYVSVVIGDERTEL